MAQDTTYKNQYSLTLDVLNKDEGAPIVNGALVDYVAGESNFYNYLGPIASGTLNPAIGDDTVTFEADYRRRNVTLNERVWNGAISKRDMLMMSADPTDGIIETIHEYMNGEVTAAAVEALTGTALSGKAGTTSVALPASQIIASTGGTYSGDTAGLNLTKFKGAITLLQKNKQGKELFCIMNPVDHNAFLDIEQVTNADYGFQALKNGETATFMGVRIIVDADCPEGTVVMWTRKALRCCYGTGDASGTEVIVDRNMNKNHRYEVFASMWVGFARMIEDGVVKILTA